jgi:hypothetical protein
METVRNDFIPVLMLKNTKEFYLNEKRPLLMAWKPKSNHGYRQYTGAGNQYGQRENTQCFSGFI